MFYDLHSWMATTSIIWNGSFYFSFPKGRSLYLKTSPYASTINFYRLNYACSQELVFSSLNEKYPS